ncbi:hypothetical protein [Aliidiomarina sp. B3213]|uniref:hypothetical protein n=1 Tax=Aliidiomarina sp. B3213 TaxID=2249757 RepID=UPI000DD0A095|nr:hypothetical protein [Aliidiomarina sp. B3213]RTE86360.1 hypothetical protein DQX04_07290 [Aliidiomarina sp. B3213]
MLTLSHENYEAAEHSSVMKTNIYARLLKYRKDGFTLAGQYKRHLPLILFRLLSILLVVFSDLFLPQVFPTEIKFLFIGLVVGSQVQEIIWIYKHFKTWNLLVDTTDWDKVEAKSRCE